MSDREERKDIPLPDTARGASVTVKSIKRRAADAPPPLGNGHDPAYEPQGQAVKAAGPKFPVIAWEDITFDADEEWLVAGIFPRIGLVCLYGGPGSVKTFILLDLFLRIAFGGLWGGRTVEQAPVVYIAAEGANGIKKRIAGLKKVLADNGLRGDVPFHLITVAPNLGTGNGDLKELIANIESAGIRPGAIAIDTAAQSIAGADENSIGMAQLVTNGTALANHFSCLVALVHHVPLADDERLRGGTALIGALDVSILSKRAKGAFTATLDVKKMKDGDDEQSFRVHLARIVLGHTKNGGEVSTLVVESVEPGAAEGPKASVSRLPKSARIALDALNYAVGETGTVPPACTHIPAGVKCTTIDQWRTYAFNLGICTSGEPRARRKAFKAGSETLIAQKSAGVWGDYAWPA